MEQGKHDAWKNMVSLKRYHVMSEKETIEKLTRENHSRNICTSDHAMMAWENLEEPINENENDSEDYNSPEDGEILQMNLIEEEGTDDEFSEFYSSTDYDCLE